MDVGLALPQYHASEDHAGPLPWATVCEWAVRAEKAGFRSVWLPDRPSFPVPRRGGPPVDVPALEPVVALAGLARATVRVRLGTLVLAAPLRPPAVLAKALATVDVLSGGRLTVGIGAGSASSGYQAAGVAFEPPAVRLEQLSEAIAVLRGAFTGEPFSFHGRHYRTEGMRCRPRPAQEPGPPVWVGGRSAGLLGVVAESADGWNAAGWSGTVDEYRARLRVLGRRCDELGRDPATLARSVNRHALVGEDEADLRRRWDRRRVSTPGGATAATTLAEYRRGHLVGTMDQVRQQVADWAGAGVTALVVNLGALPFQVTHTDDLELLASASA